MSDTKFTVGAGKSQAPSYSAYTERELEKVNNLLFAARQEAASLGMATIVRAVDEVRGPLAAKIRERTAGAVTGRKGQQ